jgi:DivIVA domain-containing protein
LDDESAELAGWLRAACAGLAMGGGLRYLAQDVDVFVSAIAADLDSGLLPDPERVRAVRFRVTRLRAGYQQREVDELIRALTRRLDEAADVEVPADSDVDAMITRIRNAEFHTVRLSEEGYDERQVDEFLEGVIAALRRGGPGSPPTGFKTARVRPGYRKQDVDALVREIWPDR